MSVQEQLAELTHQVAAMREEIAALKATQCPTPGACGDIKANEGTLFERVRNLELWQATRTGQITLIGFVFGVVGAAVIAGGVTLIKHFIK